MFTTDEPTPARWNNTGGDVRIHLVPAGTVLLESKDADAGGFLPRHHFQVTVPICGLGVYHGSWSHAPEVVPPLRPCTACFPVGTSEATVAPVHCYHPRACLMCNSRGAACGAHAVGDVGHDRCGRR